MLVPGSPGAQGQMLPQSNGWRMSFLSLLLSFVPDGLVSHFSTSPEELCLMLHGGMLSWGSAASQCANVAAEVYSVELLLAHTAWLVMLRRVLGELRLGRAVDEGLSSPPGPS